MGRVAITDNSLLRESGSGSARAPECLGYSRNIWDDPDDDLTLSREAPGTNPVSKLCPANEIDGAINERFIQQGRITLQCRSRTKWASLHRSETILNPHDHEIFPSRTKNEIGNILREGAALVHGGANISRHRKHIPSGVLDTSRVLDANANDRSTAVVRSVHFHPQGNLLLTASLDKSLRFFKIDGTVNPKVHSVYFDDNPIYRARFVGDGSEVVVSGRKDYFYVHNVRSGAVERIAPFPFRGSSLESFVETPESVQDPMLAFLGADGNVPLVSLKCRSRVGAVKMNGSVRCASFTPDGTQLTTSGGDGHIYLWDLRNQGRCVEQYAAEDGLAVTSLSCSPTGKQIFAGGISGALNIYGDDGLGTPPKQTSVIFSETHLPQFAAQEPMTTDIQVATKRDPIRSILNLTTEVDNLSFSNDAQLLAFSSRLDRDALRLLHVPTRTIFSNWPSSKTPLHYVWSTCFSPAGDYFAVGNARGRALLFRIHQHDH
ncbi:U3 small nucleolar rna-associated protein 18 [Micromonas pusilla CCMP1545]|jgi:U3 small nucleolar RNA-associated protein 18|uniref:U3 small nucleolar rna-associated protein 18 n=1 Tax=Micromonas pusilla (strain CCMP1545) TaxID=564608 RepID=C1MKX9_MICPC|nr:U3 small nucleolar rna-associated protein 18 [Micromonas pusilla CCMP1545]EEH59839.1 U3 small nucleolar rna-associated protein 18 [Micromonas pusilla CCMP1545]|eukprot:XP_003056463.1 U3 small nucleolar rna-associated protein 18 [Micromonas pusilla CCMP1545]